MTTKRNTAGPGPPPDRRPTLTAGPDDTLTATWPRRVVRFLLSDGTTLDVDTERDDSDLRWAVLDRTGVERIEGSTVLRPPADTDDTEVEPGRV